jgi:hypothetical protein
MLAPCALQLKRCTSVYRVALRVLAIDSIGSRRQRAFPRSSHLRYSEIFAVCVQSIAGSIIDDSMAATAVAQQMDEKTLESTEAPDLLASSTTAAPPPLSPPAAGTTGQAEAGPSTARPRGRQVKRAILPDELYELCRKRVTTIKEGDNVLLRMPSDSVKAVVASKEGCVVCPTPAGPFILSHL